MLVHNKNNRMLTDNKNRILSLLKINSIVILLLIPINLSSQGLSNAASYDWPAIIAQHERELKNAPHNPQKRAQLASTYNNYGLIFAAKKQWDLAQIYLNRAI